MCQIRLHVHTPIKKCWLYWSDMYLFLFYILGLIFWHVLVLWLSYLTTGGNFGWNDGQWLVLFHWFLYTLYAHKFCVSTFFLFLLYITVKSYSSISNFLLYKISCNMFVYFPCQCILFDFLALLYKWTNKTRFRTLFHAINLPWSLDVLWGGNLALIRCSLKFFFLL